MTAVKLPFNRSMLFIVFQTLTILLLLYVYTFNSEVQLEKLLLENFSLNIIFLSSMVNLLFLLPVKFIKDNINQSSSSIKVEDLVFNLILLIIAALIMNNMLTTVGLIFLNYSIIKMHQLNLLKVIRKNFSFKNQNYIMGYIFIVIGLIQQFLVLKVS